jgi:hypothetical protein
LKIKAGVVSVGTLLQEFISTCINRTLRREVK